jgi:inner membrane protein
MPTVMTHAVVGWGLARALRRADRPVLARRRELAAAVVACLPDADVIAFSLGIPYEHILGHRGASHSLLAGLLLGVAVWLAVRASQRGEEARAGALTLGVLCLAAVSHGLLDMFTDGGLGIALFAPDHQRYFWPVQPVPVSPIGLGGFLARGLPVFAWEIVLLWPIGLLGHVKAGSWPLKGKAVAAGGLALVSAAAWWARLGAAA